MILIEIATSITRFFGDSVDKIVLDKEVKNSSIKGFIYYFEGRLERWNTVEGEEVRHLKTNRIRWSEKNED